MKLLVTGCQGFVGRSVSEYALRKGQQVMGVARSEIGALTVGLESKCIALDSPAFVELLNRYRPDVVLHAAGSASVGFSFQQPREDFLMAVETWGAVLDAVRRSHGNPVVVFPSSAAVYGNPDRLPVSEQARLQPISPYGFHKVICEQLAQEYCRCFGLNVVVTRLFSTVGVYQQRLLVWELFRQALDEAPYLTLQGTGDETRDFLLVDDIVEYILGISAHQPEGFSVVNMGSGVETSVRSIAEYVLAAVGCERQILSLNKHLPGDPKSWRAEVSLLRQLVPHEPKSIQTAVEICVQHWLLTGPRMVEGDVICGELRRP